MLTPSLILWERSGDWAARLRRALGPAGPALREVRTAAECLGNLSSAPGSLVVVEFAPSRAGDVWKTLWQIECAYPAARSLVLAEREWTEYAPQAFEAGARGFIMSARDLHQVAKFARRHFEVTPAVERASWAEQALDLPQVVDELFTELSRSGDGRARQRCLQWLAQQLPRPDSKMRKH